MAERNILLIMDKIIKAYMNYMQSWDSLKPIR
jgi:hypothetical protein